MIYTRGSTSAALSKQGSGPGGSEGQRSSSTAVTSVQGGAGGHADDHTMEIDQVSDGKYSLHWVLRPASVMGVEVTKPNEGR